MYVDHPTPMTMTSTPNTSMPIPTMRIHWLMAVSSANMLWITARSSCGGPKAMPGQSLRGKPQREAIGGSGLHKQ